MKILKKILPIQKGYYLEDEGYEGFLSVIVPVKSDNLVINPIMDDINNDNKPENWLIPDGGINPIIYDKIEGGPFWTHYYEYCWPTTGGPGIGGGTISALIDDSIKGQYTASIWAKSTNSAKFHIQVYYDNGSGVTVDSIEFVTASSWNQYSFTFDTGLSTGTGVQVRIVGTDTKCLHVAAAQLEKGKYPTTLIHGYKGNGYKWLGTPFASASRRDESVLSGGRKINLRDLGMKLTSIDGLGIPDIDHSVTELAFKYGSKFNGMSLKDRDYDMEFILYSISLKDLLCSRNKVGQAIFTLNRPVTFVWQPLDCGVPICEEVLFTAVYKSGFSLGLNAHYGEEIKLNFVGYDIEMNSSITTTAVLNSVVSLSHPAIIGLDNYGNMQLLPPLSTISPSIYKCRGMVISPYDGNLYAIFDDGGAPFTPRGVVLQYNGSAWTKIAQGSTANGAMTAIHADGRYLYVGISLLQTIQGQGSFSGTSGVGMARINLAAQTVDNIGSLSSTTTTARNGFTTVQPIIRAFATDENGALFVGGSFVGTTTATAKFLMLYSGGTWYETGAIFTSYVGGIHTLYYDREFKRLYFGGDQMSPLFVMAPNTYNVFAYLDMTDPVIGVGVPVRTDFPIDLATEPAMVKTITKYKNRIVLGGKFRSSYGFDQALLDNIAYYDPKFQGAENVNGAIFPFGGRGNGWGIDDAFADATGQPATNPVEHLEVCDEILYISGKMQYYGIRSSAITFHYIGEVCGGAKYISTSEVAEVGQMMPDLAFGYVTALPYTQCYQTQALCGSEKLNFKRFYTTYLLSGSDTTITTYTTPPTIVTLCSTDLPTSPRFILRGPGKLTEISNQTYGLSLYFDYNILPGETLNVDLTTSPATVISSLNGDISTEMLPASTPGAFKLFPGENSIIVKVTWNTVSSVTLFAIQYNRQTLSAESLCCDCTS